MRGCGCQWIAVATCWRHLVLPLGWATCASEAEVLQDVMCLE